MLQIMNNHEKKKKSNSSEQEPQITFPNHQEVTESQTKIKKQAINKSEMHLLKQALVQ